MATERTLSIVKPDAVSKNAIGGILSIFEKGGLRVVATKMIRLTRPQAEGFYAVHKERPFFGDLCTFMTEGPVVVSVLEGEGAILKHRDLLGATDPAKAAEGTVRKLYGSNIERNAAHGSDGPDTAAFEIGYFFNALELQAR
ncbi:MAG TPA: nucleoside-diphosphate kinase [Candidatus Limnocylindrales bacterium]|nr:nucleoside-diphosphate kinase [Candidatus Limnocylindrales bacterium]